MCMDRLYPLIKDVDLFAVEAKQHSSFLRSFRTAFANYECSTIRKMQKNGINELAAHKKAFSSVLEQIKTHIVEANGIVRLVALWILYVDRLTVWWNHVTVWWNRLTLTNGLLMADWRWLKANWRFRPLNFKTLAYVFPCEVTYLYRYMYINQSNFIWTGNGNNFNLNYLRSYVMLLEQ